jgi:hypothetical protein
MTPIPAVVLESLLRVPPFSGGKGSSVERGLHGGRMWSAETVRAGDQPALRGGGGFFAGGSRLNGEAMTAAGFFGALGFLISRLLRF